MFREILNVNISRVKLTVKITPVNYALYHLLLEGQNFLRPLPGRWNFPSVFSKDCAKTVPNQAQAQLTGGERTDAKAVW